MIEQIEDSETMPRCPGPKGVILRKRRSRLTFGPVESEFRAYVAGRAAKG
jgi:hypothetical protein